MIGRRKREELMTRDENEMTAALMAVLLFHSGGEWDDDKRQTWKFLTGTDEATAKTLCDFVRKSLPVIAADT